LTWINRVDEIISVQRAFETEFITTMGMDDIFVKVLLGCDPREDPLEGYEIALVNEHQKTAGQIQDLLASKARIGVDFALVSLLGHIIGPLMKSPAAPVLSHVFRESGNCILIMKTIEAKGLHQISREDVRLYLQGCSNFICEVWKSYAASLLGPPSADFRDWLPTEEDAPLTKELHHLARDVLQRTLPHVLLYKNKNIESPDTEFHADFAGRSLLHIASYHGNIDAVKLLLGTLDYSEYLEVLRGRDASKDFYGLTPLDYAAGTGNAAVVQLFLNCNIGTLVLYDEDEPGNIPLLLSAIQGHDEVVRLLLKALDTGLTGNEFTSIINSIINSGDYGSGTVLHHAVYRGHRDVIKALLEVDLVDVNIASSSGYRPIHFAILGEPPFFSEILDLLRQRLEFDINVQEENGNTALHDAVELGNEEAAISLLGTPEIDIRITDNEGNTALHIAARAGMAPVVRSLIDMDSSIINVVNNAGSTALYYSVLRNHDDVVALLLASQVIDVNARTCHGLTPILIASNGGNRTIMKMLLKTGKVNVETLGEVVKEAHLRGSVPTFLQEAYLRTQGGLEIGTILEEDDSESDSDPESDSDGEVD
jgi:ankyrin repeat protein